MKLGQVTVYHHLHGFCAGMWMLVMLIEPILYQRNKIELHRKLGKIAAYCLTPLLIISALKVIYLMVTHTAAYPPGATYELAFIDVTSLILFVFFLCLAVKYSRRIHWHVAFMTGTLLVIMPPAITRALFFIPWFNSFDKTLNASYFIVELILLYLLLVKRHSTQQQRPYAIALFIFIAVNIAFNYAGDWAWWHKLIDAYAAI